MVCGEQILTARRCFFRAFRYPGLAFLAGLMVSTASQTANSEDTAVVRIIARDGVVMTKTASGPVRTIEVHDVRSRGERTRLLVETVPRPIAVAVLFAGGKGSMKLSERGEIGWGNGNFLIRSRPFFQRMGFTTAIIDAPTDHPRDLRHGFRGSPEHAADIGAVTAHLRKIFNLPVWLIGTSRGTNSVASAAAKLTAHRPDGIVLTASMLTFNEKGDHLFNYALDQITVPVLIAHHEDDGCFVTPPGEIPNLTDRLSAAKPLKTLMYRGGLPLGNPCRAAHYHGFNGIEEIVVRDIVNWIKTPAP